MHRRLVPAVSFATVLALGGLVYAAGSGAPARGIPYAGFLELNGNPISEAAVPMTFDFYDDATAGALLHSETVDVDVAAGRFHVVLGQEGPALPESVFEAAELFVAVEIDGLAVGNRKQIYALPQAVRAGQGRSLEVTDGQIFNGLPHSSTGTDLGLYSGVDGKYVRVVTNNGRFRVYSDANASAGYGGAPDFEVRPDRSTVFGSHTVEQNQIVGGNHNVAGNQFVLGQTTTGNLSVTGRAFGAPFSPGINQNFTMPTDGFVSFSIDAIGDGPRGVGEIRVNGVTVATDALHTFSGADTFVDRASMATAVRRGDTVRLNFAPSFGNISSFTYLTRVVPFAP